MSVVVALVLALALAMAIPTLIVAAARRLGEHRAQEAYARQTRQAGVRLPPAWRVAHGRTAGPLAPTRHPRRVKVSDTAA